MITQSIYVNPGLYISLGFIYYFFMMNQHGWIALAIFNIPIYPIIGYMFWDDIADFWMSAKYLFIPDILSIFRGEYYEDFFEEYKVFFWFGISAILVYSEGQIIMKYAPLYLPFLNSFPWIKY